MIDVFIGTQGSGKSLTSIHYLFELIETVVTKDGKEKVIKVPRHTLYKRLITCVGGFNPDFFREKSGNNDIEIIHHDKFLYKDDLQIIFFEQMKEKEKPQNERIPTLFIYDECQFGLSTFSSAKENLESCEFISNFFSLQRHYGPCDFLLMTQDIKKIHSKYLGIDFRLFIALETAKKRDPENDIVFDLYDHEGKNIITGGRNAINFKKTKLLKDCNGEDFNPFDMYVSGDGGRKPAKKQSFWFKYVYILIALVIVIALLVTFTFTSLYSTINKTATIDINTSKAVNTNEIPNDYNLSLPPPNSVKNARGVLYNDENSTYSKYVKEPYNNIDSQILHRVFVMDNIYYIGTQLLTLEQFKDMVAEQVFFVVSTQPITKKSFYVNLLVHQSVLNSFGIVKDFDSSNDKRIKSSVKNSN